MKKILIIVCATLLCASCAYIPYLSMLGDDSILEEMGEKGAEEILGLPDGTIDFTPGSSEDSRDNSFNFFKNNK